MKELNIRLSSACILVYDVNSEESLNDLIDIYTMIKRIKSMLQKVYLFNKAAKPIERTFPYFVCKYSTNF